MRNIEALLSSKFPLPLVNPRCEEVFKEAISIKKSIKKFLQDATVFSKKIDELCEIVPADTHRLHFTFKVVSTKPAYISDRYFTLIFSILKSYWYI